MRRTLPDESVIILGRRNSALLIEEAEELVEIEVKPNRLVVLPAGRLHYGKQPVDQHTSYYWLHFHLPKAPVRLTESEANTILSSKEIIAHKLKRSALIPQTLDLEDSEPFSNVFHNLLYEQEHPSYTPQRFQVLLQDLLIRVTQLVIKEHQSTDIESTSSKLVYAVLSLISECLGDPNLSIKFIADRLGFNPDYVGRCFKKMMGLSVGAFIVRQRITMAATRLEETQDTVDAVYSQCGFGSSRQFYFQFKAITGMSPTDLRVRHRTMYFNSL
jgi:AraC-like DNA-binding protein